MTREKIIEKIKEICEEYVIEGFDYASHPEVWWEAYQYALEEKGPEELESIYVCTDPACGWGDVHAHISARDGSGCVYVEGGKK